MAERFCGRRPGHPPHRWTTPAGVRDGKLVVLPDDFDCGGYPPSEGDVVTASGLSAGQLADIRARAEAATPGPWDHNGWVHGSAETESYGVWAEPSNLAAPKPPLAKTSRLAQGWNDAAHIAGMNPTTTLALLDHIATLERLGDEMHAAAEQLQGDVVRVREVHADIVMGEFTHCADGCETWPCPTIAALDGPAAGGKACSTCGLPMSEPGCSTYPVPEGEPKPSFHTVSGGVGTDGPAAGGER